MQFHYKTQKINLTFVIIAHSIARFNSFRIIFEYFANLCVILKFLLKNCSFLLTKSSFLRFFQRIKIHLSQSFYAISEYLCIKITAQISLDNERLFCFLAIVDPAPLGLERQINPCSVMKKSC